MHNNLLHLWLRNNQVYSTSTDLDAAKELELWHCRLAHNYRNNIVNMSKNRAAIGLPDFGEALQKQRTSQDVIKCISCSLGKQARMSFPRRSKPRATKIGERIHIDMCGPVDVSTLAGSKYFVLLKDELLTLDSYIS